MFASASACKIPGGSTASNSPATASSSPAQSPGKLDSAVTMPPGCPPDVPVYPGARLTAAAAFTSSSQTAWGMDWETQDGIDKVKAFYSTKLNEGDWTIKFGGSGSASSFSAVFSRKSNSKAAGYLSADNSSGVTKIALSLAS